MKPVPIADYLDHISRAPDKASPRGERSLFRPRSLQKLHSADPPSSFAIGHAGKPATLSRPQDEDRTERGLWNRKPAPIDFDGRELPTAQDSVRAEEMALRLAEAHERGREEGLAEARSEAEEARAAERAAAEERAVAERVEFQLNELAQLEASIRAGFAQIEHNIGAAVARILTPFLGKEVLKYVADELYENIKRLCAEGSPSLITIRGPERMLRLLRERVADLPAEVDYIEEDGVEAVVEARVTKIVTELQPWAELLDSLDG